MKNSIFGKFASVGHRNGFGLIESMVSIAVVGIILAVAAPSISSVLQRKKVIAAANELVSVLSYGRSEAMAGQTEILVSFDSGAAARGVSCVQVATVPLSRKSNCHCWGKITDSCRVAGVPGGKMLRIYSLPISGGVTFSTSEIAWPDAAVPGRFNFIWPRLQTDLPEPLQVTVSGSLGFQLRVDMTSNGMASICAPAGAEGGYPACA